MEMKKYTWAITLMAVIAGMFTSCNDDVNEDYFITSEDMYPFHRDITDTVPPNMLFNLLEEGTINGVKIVKYKRKYGITLEGQYDVYVPLEGAEFTISQSDSLSFLYGNPLNPDYPYIDFKPDLVYDNKNGNGYYNYRFYVSFDPSVSPMVRGNVIRSPYGNFYEGSRTFDIRITKSSKPREFAADYSLWDTSGQQFFYRLHLLFHQRD